MNWIDYLDEVAAHPTTRAYRQRARTRLAIRSGERVLEVGCGTGGETPALASAAGPSGLVVGVDRDGELLAEARRRAHRDSRRLDLVRADLRALPFGSASFDACVADRVLHWLPEAAGALAEMRRVLRPGGRAVVTEPDWSTLSFSPETAPLTRKLERFYRAGSGGSRVGRSLGALMLDAGFGAVDVDVFAGLVDDFETATRLLRLDETLALLARDAEADDWRNGMRQATARGAFGVTLVGYTAFGRCDTSLDSATNRR